MDILNIQELNRCLGTRLLGRSAVLLGEVDSTNNVARSLLVDSPADGTVIIADKQTAGRGRLGRAWVSEGGCGLWMTAILRPFMDISDMQKLTLLAGLAVCRAVEDLTGGALKPVIKWPNDVLAGARKLCGILCESALDGSGQRQVLVGIGVNTRTPQSGYGDAAGVAVSLEQAAGKVVPRLELAAAILGSMEDMLDRWRAEGFAPVASVYRSYMLPPGSLVVILDGKQQKRGTIEGLDDSGALLVRLESGELERVISGEITLRGVGGYV